jgi:hypothetical protein
MGATAPRFMENLQSQSMGAHWDSEGAMPFWTAPAACRGVAKRSLERQRRRPFRLRQDVWAARAASKSGVALRFPPQSKTWRQFEWFMGRRSAGAGRMPFQPCPSISQSGIHGPGPGSSASRPGDRLAGRRCVAKEAGGSPFATDFRLPASGRKWSAGCPVAVWVSKGWTDANTV